MPSKNSKFTLSDVRAKSITALRAVLAALCVFAFAFTLVGCATQNPAEQQGEGEEAKPLTSSEYMAQVNLSVEKLNERLQGFVDAVSREDTVTMRTQADNAFAVLDEIAAIEPPEELKDLRGEYIGGCDKLKDALSSYVTLYTEVANARTNGSFDYSTYTDRIAEIQSTYDEGIQALKDADDKATKL